MNNPIGLYEEAKRLMEEDFLKPSNRDLFITLADDGPRVPAFKRSGTEPVNFVYGEVLVSDFLEVLEKVAFQEGETFVDLGCGTGNCLAAAALFRSSSIFQNPGGLKIQGESVRRTKIVGIDLARSKLVECRIMLAHLNTLIDQNSFPKLPDIEVLESDILKNGDNIY